jgi:1-pyrroline-5-carboxylate dehydrogenase
MAEGFRVTYATMSADNEQMHAEYDKGIEQAKAELGQKHPFYVTARSAGRGHARGTLADRLRARDRHVRAGHASGRQGRDRRAKAYFLTWANTPWQERVKIMSKAADLISERRNELAALMAIEVGKNRLEALGDVEESADLIRWNCHELEQHNGFTTPMQPLGAAGEYTDVMRPYGVWGVISPFNFPLALAAGPTGAALVAGNTVVFKPSNAGAMLGIKLYEVYRDAGVPPAVFHCITGGGDTVGAELVENPDVSGLTFTGSYAVG